MPAPMQPNDNQIQELKSMIRETATKIDQIKDDLPRLYVSRADFEQRQETLEDTTRHISEKLDALSQGLPDRFLDRAQYLITHAALEKRVETGEGRVEELRKEVAVEKQRASELYANGMQWANQTFTEIRDLIIQKSETQEGKLNQIQIDALQRDKDQHQQLGAQIRVVLISVVCGGVLAFVSTLILHAMHVL